MNKKITLLNSFYIALIFILLAFAGNISASVPKRILNEGNSYNVESDYINANIAKNSNDVVNANYYFTNLYTKLPWNDDIAFKTFLYTLANGEQVKKSNILLEISSKFQDSKSQLNDDDKLLLYIYKISYLLKKNKIKEVREIFNNQEFKNLGSSKEIITLKKKTEAVLCFLENNYICTDQILSDLYNKYQDFNSMVLKLLLFEDTDFALSTTDFLEKFNTNETRGLFYFFSLAEYMERNNPKMAKQIYDNFSIQFPSTRYKVSIARKRMENGIKPKKIVKDSDYLFSNFITEYANFLFLKQATKLLFSKDLHLYEYISSYAQIAKSLSPRNGHAFWIIGRVWEYFKNYDKAYESYQLTSIESPNYEVSNLRAIQVRMIDDKNEDALKTALRNKNIYSPLIANQTGHVYFQMNDYENAVLYYSKAINSLRDNNFNVNWQFYIDRANVYLEIDDWDNAEKDMLSALEIAPNEPIVLNFLGYSWADRAKNIEKSITYLQKALRMQPYSGAIADSLGWAYFKAGDFKNALRYIEKAVELSPTDPTITEHLGDVYWYVGKLKEAKHEWVMALEFEEDNDNINRIKSKISNGINKN